MKIIPLTYQRACDFVNQFHRHHSASQGCKFCIGLEKDKKLVGVAICGRPVARKLDDGFTLEINRVCTLGDRNACSMLYGACCRIAKDMGYKEVITYTLESESGISLRASNFTNCGLAGGKKWNGIKETKQVTEITLFGEEIIKKSPPEELKIKWSKKL